MPKRAKQEQEHAYDDGSHFGSYTLSKKARREQPAGEGGQAAAPSDAGPFPKFSRPTEAECRAARDALAALHGLPVRSEPADSAVGKGKRTVLDSLVQTILSQNTTDTNSHRTFANLKARFPTWELVRDADPGEVETAIKMGGLAATKTARIQEILASVHAERGTCSLEHLRERSDADIKAELLQYKGVGPKTAACVLMFCLGRFEFPVDTHVWRITKSLGWVPERASREQTYEHLNARIPADAKYDLHVLLVEHGKRCARCAKKRPSKEPHGPCPLVRLAAAADGGAAPLQAAVLELAAEDVPLRKDTREAAADAVKQEPGVLKQEAADVKQEAGEVAVKAEPGSGGGVAVKQEAAPAVKVEPASPPPREQHPQAGRNERAACVT